MLSSWVLHSRFENSGVTIMNIGASIKSIEFIIEFMTKPIKVGDPSFLHGI